MTAREGALTMTVVVFLQRDRNPELVDKVPPNEHEDPPQKFQDTTDHE